ncbi:MAG: helix-turn-helix transcriptional regulator [Limnochordales bacterium]|nr:helix-turn-helix transcriptional regulator [Limnochordales bacterium]
MEKVKRLNLEQLKLLAHPLRQRILRAFAGAEQLSVQELAERLKLPHGKVYYHVQRLVAGGLLAESGHRTVNGIVERLYEPAAADFIVADEELRHLPGYHVLAACVVDNVFAQLIEMYRRFQQLQAERAAAEPSHRASDNNTNRQPAGFSASFADLLLTAEEAEDLGRRVADLIDRYRQRQRARQSADGSNAVSLQRVQYVVLTFTNLPPESPKAGEDKQ